jgi:GTPase SAR1 family protein
MLQIPIRGLISGCAGSGKSSLLSSLLQNQKRAFSKPFDKIFYCTNNKQSIPSDLTHMVTHIQGIPEEELINAKEDSNRLFVLDDILESVSNSETVLRLYLYSRHNQTSVITLCQNLFFKSKYLRTLSLNSNYIFVMYTKRDLTSIDVLGRQMFPQNPKLLSTIFDNHINKPYKYLLLSYEITEPNELKLRSDILNEQGVETFLPGDIFETLKNENENCFNTSEKISFFTP